MTDAAGHPDRSRDVTLTPLDLIAKLGVFDFDPCGYPGHATARHVVTLPTDGLREKWVGRVWLNPPYSDPTPWLEKLADHGNGIAMVLASTDTAWFQDFVAPFAVSVLFLRGRPRFQRPDGSRVGLMRASCFAAYGARNAAHLRASGMAGWLATTMKGTP